VQTSLALPAPDPGRAARHRPPQDQGRGGPRRQVPALLVRPPRPNHPTSLASWL